MTPKNPERNNKTGEDVNRVWKIIYPIVLIKMQFWALSYFGGLTDLMKQTTQVNINYNNTNDNNDYNTLL